MSSSYPPKARGGRDPGAGWGVPVPLDEAEYYARQTAAAHQNPPAPISTDHYDPQKIAPTTQTDGRPQTARTRLRAVEQERRVQTLRWLLTQTVGRRSLWDRLGGKDTHAYPIGPLLLTRVSLLAPHPTEQRWVPWTTLGDQALERLDLAHLDRDFKLALEGALDPVSLFALG